MAKQLPPEVESRLLKALSLNNPDGAIAVMREHEPGWGVGKPGDAFGLSFDPALFRFLMMAEPPQIERFTPEQRKQLRITAVMQHFIGDQRGSEKWLPQDVAWAYRDEPLTAVRMCYFWARSAQLVTLAKALGHTKKRVLGEEQKGDPRYARCPHCVSIRERGFIGIDEEFEPGIKFPPFRGCTLAKYACRCDLEFA
jgi:hypothetical protein